MQVWRSFRTAVRKDEQQRSVRASPHASSCSQPEKSFGGLRRSRAGIQARQSTSSATSFPGAVSLSLPFLLRSARRTGPPDWCFPRWTRNHHRWPTGLRRSLPRRFQNRRPRGLGRDSPSSRGPCFPRSCLPAGLTPNACASSSGVPGDSMVPPAQGHIEARGGWEPRPRAGVAMAVAAVTW